jgi:AcrR family transcriptional regulator
VKRRRQAKHSYHHGDLRRALLDAARIELRAVGWQELSLRGVARRAGVTHTAAYHHFKDRNELLSTIAGEGFIALERHMKEAMDAAGDDAVDRLVASGVGYLKMAVRDPAAYDLMFNGCDIEASVELQKIGADPFLRLFHAVEAARLATNTTRGTVLDDALVQWEGVHGCAMLLRSGQIARMNVDVDEHVRFVTQRLGSLFRAG